MSGRGRTPNASPEDIKKLWRLVDEGYSIARASQKLGFSKAWGYQQSTRRRQGRMKPTAQHHFALPPPKRYGDLDGGVKDLLKDFLSYRREVFCRDEAPWTKDVANRCVGWLMGDEKDYVVASMPPGIGKTTLFTHDLPAWLICGGGTLDPAFGRALRFLLGSKTKKVSEHYVTRLRRTLELPRPFFDKASRRQSELVITHAFGRFKPDVKGGEESLWRKDQFTVAQIENIDLYEKEPTVQAASREAGFLGERVDFYSWDDLVVRENSRTIEMAEELASWFEDEAETRLEPGGLGLLVGQRLSNIDLYRNRLDAEYLDDDGRSRKRYQHISYPVHIENSCDGTHRQWDADSDGCLLDAQRLSWQEIQRISMKSNVRTLYYQEDTDPEEVLVQQAWIEGGTDKDGYPAPGCYDRERGFRQWPSAPFLINYVTVDPSVSNFWAIEWWAINPETRVRYLIWGARKKMQAGKFLDWDPVENMHVGLMEEIQALSCALNQPIYVWVVEQNAAHKYLFQFAHFKSWVAKWKRLHVFSHETQKNKADPERGVEALLPMLYRVGMKRLPRAHGDLEALNYIRAKTNELTTYPYSQTSDTVMADWIGEHNIERIIAKGLEFRSEGRFTKVPNLPRYLARQYKEVSVVA